ncbi:hypothetical protein Ddye_027722 [Dipteronia dyeriana]|uniref:Uncharacterized protein n=1 Tax=Dipteronia dyeriana TaxID=168575 RepID=A0AAD9TQ42_9ROSI|nr:hypothetical protein Ddye_027722 [Dipteronia dyeriana]
MVILCQIRELAEKESEDGVFKMLRSDVTRFLTTILIGTTVVNIGATALVTEAATTIFGEAGVSAATGVMTVAILLLTEITPKSIAVHNATEVARFVVRPVAWLSLVLYPVGRVVTYLSMGMLKVLGLKGRSEPYVTEDELKLMLRGAELSGAIEEEEQDMIENVLEIKDTHVREVMTPLVDVVAIDASASLVDFHNLWVTHQYSRVPVFEQRVDNIVGIAYAMDMLDYVPKGELQESTSVGDMAHKPAYFVPDSMSVWNLLREFRIRKVHMAVVLNEYGGTVGVVTLEDVVEEIVGEIFDENDSKEEIQKKTGYIVMRAEGIYDVDANTSIDQLSEDLNIKMPEGHQYETVSGFICEAFGYIPRTGESIKVVLEKENQEEEDENSEAGSDRQNVKEKHFVYKLEIYGHVARSKRGIHCTQDLPMGSIFFIVAVSYEGVISVAWEGEDKDKVVVIGDGVDAATLARNLSKKLGFVDLLLVEEVKEKKKKWCRCNRSCIGKGRRGQSGGDLRWRLRRCNHSDQTFEQETSLCRVICTKLCVILVAWEGDEKNKVVMTGDGTDAAIVTGCLRKKLGYADLVSEIFSVAWEGECKDKVVVIGCGVNAATLTTKLDKKLGCANCYL